ncbi:MAG: hypothetical protein JSU71_04420 [Betaproteobacteria bacterium]|nr:MAG: hypothetical protein JSU71_04420 [Betaproteobacteria bacterium]
MNTNCTLIALLLAATVQIAYGDDNIRASFDRMLNHEPYSGPTAVTVSLDERDALADRVHASLRNGNDVAAVDVAAVSELRKPTHPD